MSVLDTIRSRRRTPDATSTAPASDPAADPTTDELAALRAAYEAALGRFETVARRRADTSTLLAAQTAALARALVTAAAPDETAADGAAQDQTAALEAEVTQLQARHAALTHAEALAADEREAAWSAWQERNAVVEASTRRERAEAAIAAATEARDACTAALHRFATEYRALAQARDAALEAGRQAAPAANMPFGVDRFDATPTLLARVTAAQALEQLATVLTTTGAAA